ncbi:hypothetical protein V0R37_03245 [Pollutimonas sp. H1-120]|uniref:hypothetical protein n=1 Tax=Pollutimonas sp. H1-120 TaxID=3148824 RepID=UPI003B51F6EB
MRVNRHFLKLWQQHDPVGRKHSGLLSLMRRHQWNLTSQQQERLAQHLEPVTVLKVLCYAKQRLISFLLLKTVKAKQATQLATPAVSGVG